MPKRKRSDFEDLQFLKKKLKLLEVKLKKPNARRRIRVIDDSSSSSSEPSRDSSPAPENLQGGDTMDLEESQVEPATEIQATSYQDHTQIVTQILDGCTPTKVDKADNHQAEITQESNSAADAALESIILDILGDDPTATTEYGKEIHGQLASRFEYFASNGLTKEGRKELSDKYLVPSNCVRIGAPMLNAEIKAALPENLVKRDKAIEARQKLIAKAISSVASAITDQLNSSDRNQDLLKQLMDTGRLLCDIQHSESVTRRNFALFSLKKDLKEHLSNTKIDKYLFGDNLSDALKAAKAVNKSGTDLKFSAASTFKKPAPPSKSQASKNLNWKPPAPARRQPGPQRSREPATTTRKQPPSSSRRSPRTSATIHRK